MASHEEPENIQVEVEREEAAPEQPLARAKPHPNTCPVCKSHYREDELRAVLRVCTVCGHHFPVGAEERVEQLADRGSFQQLAEDLRSADPLAFTDLRPYTERLSEAEVATGLGDAMVAGTATIEGMPCVLCTMDFAFMGGSMGSVVGEMFTRASDVAAERGIPLVSVAASGGARMQENVLALMQMAKTVVRRRPAARVAACRTSRVLAHPTTGGVIASFAALGDFVVAEPDALLSFAGPARRAGDDAARRCRRLRARRVEPRARPDRRRRQAGRAQADARRASCGCAPAARSCRSSSARPHRRPASSRACCASCARARTATRTRTAARREQPPADAVPRPAPPARRARRRVGHLGCRPARSRGRAAVHARLRRRASSTSGSSCTATAPATDDHAIVAGIGSFRGRTDRDRRPPEGSRPQGARVPQLRHGAAAGLRQGACACSRSPTGSASRS